MNFLEGYLVAAGIFNATMITFYLIYTAIRR